MRLTVLTLDESPRLEWRRELTRYYQETGDWSIYSLFPGIIISLSDLFDSDIDIGDGYYTFSPEPVFNGFAYVLPVRTGKTRFDTEGLFISKKQPHYSFPEIKTSVSGIMLVEAENDRYRIIRSRRLRKDRAY